MATSKILLGPIPHARYDWVSGASYGKEAIVFHKGSSYIALSDNPSTEPSFTYDPATGSYNVSAGWGLLAVGAEIVQETGDSQDKVMSQKTVTDALTASDQKLSELEKEVATNFVGIDKERVIAEAIADLFAQVEGINDKLTNGIDRLSVKRLHIDRELSGLNIAGTFCLQGAGVPSASVVPVNWDFGRYGDWKGIPQFIGQEYFDTIDKVFYKAHGVTAVSDWKRITNA